MIVIPRVLITPAMVSTTAVDEAAHSMATTYPIDALVSKSGQRWVSLQGANAGHDPEEPGSAWWAIDGSVNSMRMFDISPKTLTEFAGPATVTITPTSHCTALMLMGVVGLAVRLRVYRGALLLDEITRSVTSSDGTEHGYYFGTTKRTADVMWHGLPIPATHYEIHVSGGARTAIGVFLIGRQAFIGNAQPGASVDIELRGRDYTDENDNPVAADRGYARRLTATLEIARADFNRIGWLLESLVQQHAGWIVAPSVSDYDSAAIVGRFQRAVRVMHAKGAKKGTVAIEIAGNK